MALLYLEGSLLLGMPGRRGSLPSGVGLAGQPQAPLAHTEPSLPVPSDMPSMKRTQSLLLTAEQSLWGSVRGEFGTPGDVPQTVHPGVLGKEAIAPESSLVALEPKVSGRSQTWPSVKEEVLMKSAEEREGRHSQQHAQHASHRIKQQILGTKPFPIPPQ